MSSYAIKGGRVKTYATIGGDTDLVAAHAAMTGINSGRPAGAIRADGAGDIVVNGPQGHTETITMAAGQEILGEFYSITATGTTATALTVTWADL